MKQITNIILYCVALLSLVNLILAINPHTQVAWLSSFMGWAMAAYHHYRSEIA